MGTPWDLGGLWGACGGHIWGDVEMFEEIFVVPEVEMMKLEEFSK